MLKVLIMKTLCGPLLSKKTQKQLNYVLNNTGKNEEKGKRRLPDLSFNILDSVESGLLYPQTKVGDI